MPRKKQEDKIVRIKFSDGFTMMFGNSYKPWTTQLEEYLLMKKWNGNLDSFEEVMVSDNKWVSWGGLKWCPEDKFQHQLNREGCQDNEPNNPSPRCYSDMTFYHDNTVTKKVEKMISNLKANIY